MRCLLILKMTLCLRDKVSIEPDRKDYILMIIMERLKSDANIDTLISVFQDIGFGITPPFQSRFELFKAVKKQFDSPQSRKNIYDKCSDINFKKALRLMEPLFGQFKNDLHGDNFMIRPNSNHLVIIDPCEGI